MREEMDITEILLRDIYQNGNEELFSTPFFDDELSRWPCWESLNHVAIYSFHNIGIQKYFDTLISDNPDYNIWVNQHPRYFPNVLHSLKFIKVFCLLNGNVSFGLNGVTYQLHTGDICFLAPNTIHCFGAFEDDVVAVNLIMKTSVLEDCFVSLLKRDDALSKFFFATLNSSNVPPAAVFHTHNDPQVRKLCADLFDEFTYTHDPYSPHMLEAYTMQLFALILRNHSSNLSALNASKQTVDPHLIECIRYLYKNYTTVSLSELAAKFNYSTPQLCKIIKQYTGSSFLEFIRVKKLNVAKLLLVQTDMSIKEIAEKTGFMDISHFYRSFKAMFGKTPAECRNENID